MKRLFTKLLCCVLIILLALGVCSCKSNTAEIENLITKFEYSCKTLDINSLLDCISPEISQRIKLVSGVAGIFVDMDIDEIFESVAGELLGILPDNGDEFFSSINITIYNISVSNDSASVNTMVDFTLSGERFEKEMIFECVYEDRWYISNIDF